MPVPTPQDESPDHSSAFLQFDLDPRLQQTVLELGFETPTPIQVSAIAHLLEGRDVVGRARTGSGKTAAFGLPLLQRVKDGQPGTVQALVLAPTRELALQVTEALRTYSAGLPVRMLTVYGGAPYGPQVNALRRGVEVVVGTPGRLLDLLGRGLIDLSAVGLVVIDEADEMLRMGFIEDVERLLAATPPTRQVALFSATMPEPIRKVAEAYLQDPIEIQVEQTVLSVGHIGQRWMRVPYYHKLEALERVLRAAPGCTALVFARTRAACAETAEALGQRGYSVDALHGDLSQPAREHVMRRFRSGQISVVVATDVAARGLDVEHITKVINFDMPDDIESYVHRIGRTGRAGRQGEAISFVTPREVYRMPQMDRLLKVRIQESTVPSDAEIAAQQLAGLQQELGTALEHPEAGVARAALSRLLLSSGWSAEDVATAALSLLAKDRSVSLEAKRDERPPHWARTQQRPARREPDERARPARAKDGERPGRPPRSQGGERPRPDFAASNEVELFLATGLQFGVRPADIVGVLANEKGIPGHQIGRITLLDRKAFVGLPQAVAEALLRDASTLSIRGVEVNIAKAQPPPARGAAAPQDPRSRSAAPPERKAPKPGKPMWEKFGKRPRRGHVAPRRSRPE